MDKDMVLELKDSYEIQKRKKRQWKREKNKFMMMITTNN